MLVSCMRVGSNAPRKRGRAAVRGGTFDEGRGLRLLALLTSPGLTLRRGGHVRRCCRFLVQVAPWASLLQQTGQPLCHVPPLMSPSATDSRRCSFRRLLAVGAGDGVATAGPPVVWAWAVARPAVAEPSEHRGAQRGDLVCSWLLLCCGTHRPPIGRVLAGALLSATAGPLPRMFAQVLCVAYVKRWGRPMAGIAVGRAFVCTMFLSGCSEAEDSCSKEARGRSPPDSWRGAARPKLLQGLEAACFCGGRHSQGLAHMGAEKKCVSLAVQRFSLC